MKKSLFLIIAALLLAACQGTGPTSTPTQNGQAVMTAVKQTVDANLAYMESQTPPATSTPVPSDTPIPPTITSTAPAVAELTNTLQTTATKVTLADKAEFVSQSVPDNSKFNPGAPFSVTWTFKNVGTTTWNTDYAAKFWSDDLMGSPDTVHFSKEVKPQETIDITMSFKAPSTIGADKSSWWLQNSTGANFFPFYVAIQVVSALPTPPTSTPTTAPSATATSPVTATATLPAPTATSAPATDTPTP